MPNILVVSYSRTGTTSRIARELADQLGADFERIEEIENRAGVVGFLISALESLAKGLPAIRTVKDPHQYDLVVVGTPVWVGSMASPVRAYLEAHRTRLPRVAFFATMRARGAEDALREMKFLCRANAAASCAFTEAEVKNLRYLHKLANFANALSRVQRQVRKPVSPVADASTWVGEAEPVGELAPT
mgnify:CR=1 FL=1